MMVCCGGHKREFRFVFPHRGGCAAGFEGVGGDVRGVGD